MDKVVTINDIAKAAGVGKGTVDRVLHNRGRVSEETKKKVQKCIKEMGYKPNKAARMLAKTRRYRIAVIYHNKEEEFWKQIECGIDKAEEEYKQLGVTIKRFVLSQINVEEQEKLIFQIIEEKYDGLAIVPYYSKKTLEAINKAVSSGITVVTFNNDEKCNRLCYVGQDLLQSGKTAGKLMSMIAKPHSRYIVVLPVIESMTALYGRYEGFKEIIEKRRPDMKLLGIYNFKQDGSQAYRRIRNLIETDEIDAVYASNVIVEDVARAVFDSGKSDSILIVGHDLTKPIQKYIETGVIDASIGQEPEKQGYEAINRLCKKLIMDEDISQDVYTKIEIALAENLAYI